MSGVLLSESLRQETADAIDELISRGEPDAVAEADMSVLVECARRYVSSAIEQRNRSVVRKRERRAVDTSAIDDALVARMRVAARDYADRAVQWTVELLESSFALPDGTRVRWGDATVSQHADRASALESQAASVVETAALHRQAIDAIRDRNVNTLREVAK
jgi:hypothetical protein